MKKFLAICISLAIINVNYGCHSKQELVTEKDWWENAQLYQIYPRSFQDSNGDGIGDLNGITSKLQHLKDIGITATWLSPIFKSPMKDFGYDISDFYAIQPEYGTMNDFENLVKKANELGIKVILDFVPNHSSDENEWFKKSVNKEKGYEDFYVWHNGIPDPSSSKPKPPNNWLQAFRGSAWEWNEKRQQYYLHQYVVQQPDLNYRNPLVVERMRGVLKFWLDKGIAGFRVDAVPCMFEVAPDANGNYPDEPKSGITNDPENTNYLNHIYTQNQPETINIVYEWRKYFDDYKRIHGGDTRVLLIETYAAANYTMLFYGNRTINGAQLPFNFNLITGITSSSFTAKDLENSISAWLHNMPSGRTANWVIGNHDQKRASTRYGLEKIDAMNMLVMMLPGVSVTYQGEEIGMIDGKISWADTKDPAACNSNETIYEEFSRDPARTPFQWDASKNAGFSTGSNMWLPIAAGYEKINVDVESKTEKSHLQVYKALSALRKTKTLLNGNHKYAALNDNVLAVQRSLSGAKTYILVANLNKNKETLNLITFNSQLPKTLSYKIVGDYSQHKIGETVTTNSLSVDPFEAIILESV